MKKLIPVVFVVVAAFLAVFFICRNIIVEDNSYSRAKVVKPVVDGALSDGDDSESDYDEYDQASFIELANDETLLSIVTMDIDDDGYDDQINIVKTSRSPFLALIVGLYNPASSSYVRAAWIATNISQIRTFACTSMDVIGNHRNSLVYQGVADNGDSVLCIFNGKRGEDGGFELEKIGDFESDGTVFIQQTERNEAYELSQTRAASFPVWVYSTDSEDATKLDQIQTMYNWSEEDGRYVQVSQTRVKGSRIAANELARIQDGTVETFTKFLDGLWYKTDSSGESLRYIFFDDLSNEIVFYYQDSEEVYSWLNSNLRRNGIYFSAVNQSIENLQRRFDISLVSIDEIRIRIQDDVRMIIGESTLWDGNYKKLASKIVAKADTAPLSKVIERLEQKDIAWIAGDGKYFVFENGAYTVQGDDFADSGLYMINTVSGEQLLQFRSGTEAKFFAGYYSAAFDKVVTRQTDRRGRTTETVSDDTDTILLQPVVASPTGFFQAETQPLVLKRTDRRSDSQE